MHTPLLKNYNSVGVFNTSLPLLNSLKIYLNNSMTSSQSFNNPAYTNAAFEQIEAVKFIDVVTSRRSVRRFTDKQIPDEVLNACLEIAMLAPNSSNLQPWEFYVIETPSIRKKAVEYCMGQNAAKTANRLLAVVARSDTWAQHAKDILTTYPIQPVPKPVNTYYSKLIPVEFATSPLNLISPAKHAVVKATRLARGAMKEPMYSQADIINWAKENTMLAAENLMLALRAYGFDSCPMGGFDEPQMKKLLGLGEHQHIVMMLGAGERAEKGLYAPQQRFERERFIKTV